VGDSAEEGRFQAGRVVTISAGHAVHDTYTAFLPPLLPAFINTLRLSKTGAGFLTVFVRAPSLLQPFIGHLADRVSLRYFVILAPAVTSVAMSLLGIAPSYLVLAMLLLVAGLSSASMHAVGPVMAGVLSGKNLGRGMGIWMVGGELGRTLGPIVVVTAVELLSLEGTPWLMAGGILASLLLYVRLKDVSGRPAQAVPSPLWRDALRSMKSLMAPLSGVIAAWSLMSAAVMTYLPVFMTERGASLWLAGASLSIVEAAGVAGALSGGALSDRIGRRTVLAIAMVMAPLSMFLLLSLGGWAVFPVLLLLGFSTLSTTPVIMALVQERFPEFRALANGIYMAVSFSMGTVGTVLLGALGDWVGLPTGYTVAAAVMLLGIPLLRLFPTNGGERREEDRTNT
jgi:FSR family fosmidomycin resistance protein-like MFS transporter